MPGAPRARGMDGEGRGVQGGKRDVSRPRAEEEP